MVNIVEVTANKKLFKKFVDFPNQLYKDSPYYVPFIYGDEINMLSPKKNPASQNCKVRCFLAYKDGEIAGRIAGILQRGFNAKSGEKRMRFSRFDFINDGEVVHALLDAVEKFAREEGMEIVHGPFGFNDTDREGYLTYGFQEIATATTNYNYEYYDERIKEQGYAKECGWLEYNINVPPIDDPMVQRVLRLSEIVKKRFNLTVPKYDNMKQIIKERIQQFFDIYMEAYNDLPGFIEYNEDQKIQIAKAFGQMLRPEFLPIVTDKNDKMIAFGVVLPDMTLHLQKSRGRLNLPTLLKILGEIKRPKKKMEMALVGVSLDWRNKGVNAILIAEVLKELYRMNVTELETNLNAEENANIHAMWNDFDKRQHKRRICVYKNLTQK